MLVQKGSPVNHQDQMGQTALFVAAFGDHVEVVNTLIELGANPAMEVLGGATAMEVAKSDQMREVLQKGILAWAAAQCEMKDAGSKDCLKFTDLLRGRIFEKRELLIQLGHDARTNINGTTTTQVAKTHREHFYEQTRDAITISSATTGQQLLTNDVAVTWRQMVLCPKNKVSTVEKVFELFLCVQLPKLQWDAASKVLRPIKKALLNIHLNEFDTNSDDVIDKGEFVEMQKGLIRKMHTQSRRLLGGADGYCEGATQMRKWEIVQRPDGLQPAGSFVAAFGVAGGLLAAAVLSMLGLVARRRGGSESPRLMALAELE